MKEKFLLYSLVILSGISFFGEKLSWDIINIKSDNSLLSIIAILLFLSVSFILPFLNTLIFLFNLFGKKLILDKIFSSLVVIYGTMYLVSFTIIGARNVVSELVYENSEIAWIILGILYIIISLYKRISKI